MRAWRRLKENEPASIYNRLDINESVLAISPLGAPFDDGGTRKGSDGPQALVNGV